MNSRTKTLILSLTVIPGYGMRSMDVLGARMAKVDECTYRWTDGWTAG